MVDLQEIDMDNNDVSDFLVRSRLPEDSSEIKSNNNKSKFAKQERLAIEENKSETSVGLSSNQDDKIIIIKEQRNSILRVEEEGDLHLVDNSK